MNKQTIKNAAKQVGIFAAAFGVTYLVIKGVEKVAENILGEQGVADAVAQTQAAVGEVV